MTSDELKQGGIVILDFGSQYTQLIARRVRELGVYCEIRPYDMDLNILVRLMPGGIIFSGGPDSVTSFNEVRAPQAIFNLGIPILGICYGMHTMAIQLGGLVETSSAGEFGPARALVIGACKLLDGIDDAMIANEKVLDVWMSHHDQVRQLPPGFEFIASTEICPIAGMADEIRGLYGLQFHPEVTHTRQGSRILERFVRKICEAKALWTTKNIVDNAIVCIRAQVGMSKVILGLSGGVDSTVTATLLHLAIGPQLTCVFVDNGLLRLNEAEQVMEALAKNMGVRVIRVDAEGRFLVALRGVTDPEEKRRIIGQLFIQIFEEQAAILPGVHFLAQGTIYPDVIESKGIKTHHNVGGLPEKMRLQLVEPLRDLFKDEVRQIGLDLGLPREIIYRHPFPGPGLAVRIIGEVKKEFADILRQADAIFIEELHKHSLYDHVSQAFAVFLPIKSVAVKGDARRYEYVIALRAVITTDFMTATAARLPYEFLDIVESRIINEVPNISRVTYDISNKPPATIEWE